MNQLNKNIKMDNNGTINIHLNKLNDVSVVDVRGRKCVVIPVDNNGIYISEKGTIVLSYFMSKMQEEKWGKTHSLKRKLTKEEYKTWTKEQRENNPVAGYFEPWKPREGYNSGGSQAPSSQAPSSTPINSGNNGGNIGDLPF